MVCGMWGVCRCVRMGGGACMCVWGLGMWGGVGGGGWMGACVLAVRAVATWPSGLKHLSTPSLSLQPKSDKNSNL